MTGLSLILRERNRQRQDEGWHDGHDDDHEDGSLALAAASYALSSAGKKASSKRWWPWRDDESYKPKTPMRDLVRAGALIAAEIDRRIRSGETK